MYQLPTTINIGGKDFKIRKDGDYRMVLDCMMALNDVELKETERLISCLIMFYEDVGGYEELNKLSDIEEAAKKMIWFFNLGSEEKPGLKTHYNLIDYNKDEQLICSAINNVANTEIRSVPYCHWWTFMGYYMAIGECTLSTIVNIRYKIASRQKLEKYELKFKNENPQYFDMDYRSVSEQDVLNEFLQEVWNKGK